MVKKNLKNLKNLANSMSGKIKKYKSEHPLIIKNMIISCSGIAALTVTIIAISVSSPPGTEKANEMQNEPSVSTSSLPVQAYAADTYSSMMEREETKAVSRGTPAPLDPLKGDIIKKGIKNSIVLVLQRRLTELDYIESDEPSEEYGEAMELAVQLFQRKNELEITGEVDKDTYQLLISEEAKKYTVSLGAEGVDVEHLQTRLYELGYLSKVTGYFGTDTDIAVKEFQKRNGLDEDGNVGHNTREKLYSAEAVPLSFYLGDENDEIRQYQQRLFDLGYLTSKPDGKYGNDTVIAVKRFQEKHGLIADGHFGPATKDLLLSADASENAIILGDSGNDVTNIQNYLKKLGYLKNVTGYFGTDTNEAVINFQRRNGLTADGKVGTQTINQLLSSDAKKWTSSTGTGSSGSSGGSNSGSSGSNSNSGSDNGGAVSPSVDRLIEIARTKLGARYVYGAKGPNTFDCSGFVYWVLNKAGVKQGYLTSYGWQKTTRYQKITSMSSIKKGDIISYKGHVGIAIGNGQMIDASSSQGKVRITNINSSYWVKNFVCAYRIF